MRGIAERNIDATRETIVRNIKEARCVIDRNIEARRGTTKRIVVVAS